MASVSLKSLKLTNFHYASFLFKRIRCGHFILNNDGCSVIQKLSNLSSKRFLSNIAHEFDIVDLNSSKERDAVKNIDFVFSKIDFEVRRTGRTNLNFVKEIFDKVKLSGTVSSLHGLFLIRCCGKLHGEIPSVRITVINNIWKTLQDMNIPLTCEHYNALLRVHLQNGTDYSPMEILSEMESKNIVPNMVTYQLFVEQFSNEGNLTGVSTILEYMKDKGISVTEAIFNSLIKCHAKINDLEGANSMLTVMRNSNLNPSAKTYTILSCMYAEAGDLDGVTKTLSNAQNSGIMLSNENYLDLITSLAVGGNKQFIDKIMQQLIVTDEYHQDFITAIMKLIIKGFEDVSYKFFSLLGQSKFSATANLFIKQLIKAGTPVDTIISYCNQFNKGGHDDCIYLYAAKLSIDYNRADCVMGLLREMQKQGYPVRTHNFNYIMEHYRESNNLEGAWKMLSLMYELGVLTSFKIYSDCTYLGVSHNLKPDELIAKFESCGHTPVCVVPVLFQFYCDNLKLNEAKYIAENYPTEAGNNFKLKTFLSRYATCENSRSFLQHLEYILRYEPEPAEGMNKKNYGDFLVYVMRQDLKLLEDFLKMLNEQGFKLEVNDFLPIESALKVQAPNLLTLLSKMKSTTQKSTNDQELSINSGETIGELEENLLKFTEKGYATGAILFKLLNLHITEKNTTKLVEIIQELESQKFTLSASIYSQLINLFVAIQDLEMTSKLFKALKEQHPEYKIDSVKIINYVYALIKYGKNDDAVNILNKDLKDSFPPVNKDAFERTVKKLLRAASELADVSLVKNLYSALENAPGYKFISEDSSFFDALVKVHLARGDLQSAIEEYRNCARTRHVFPCRNILLRKCIYSDNSDILQKVVDITAAYGGESTALCELAGVFIELGRIREAKKILQNLGGKTDFRSVEQLCMNFSRMNKEHELKNLINITQDLWHIDRDKLYYSLFELYDKRNDYIGALAALKSFKNESLKPSERTMTLLSNLLKRNKQASPFDASSEKSSTEFDHRNSIYESKSDDDISDENNSDVASFLKCVDTNHASEALQILEKMKKGHVRSIPLEYMSYLIDSLVQNKMLNELTSIVQPMSYIIDNCKDIFKPLLEKYSNAGDVELCQEIGNTMPDFLLRNVHFNFFLCRAYINSERYEDLLSELEQRCNKKNKLFSVPAFSDLLKHTSDSEDRIINLALRYMDEIKYDVPLSAIWAHYFTSEDYTKAEDFYKRYPVAVEKVDIIVNNRVRNDQNHKLGRKFIDFLIQRDLKQRQKNRAYSSQLDVLVTKSMYKEAASLMAECERQQVSLLHLRRSTLITLKDALEKENMAVTFSIPESEDSESSSDSE